jgi:hypothetical protein
MAQHVELAQDRWSAFTLDQQILMIANEMNRAFRLVLSADIDRVKNSYERVLHLTDLTVRAQTKSALRWELLRWRDLIAELYIDDTTRPDEHRQAFRCLLYFTPEASRQIPHLSALASHE